MYVILLQSLTSDPGILRPKSSKHVSWRSVKQPVYWEPHIAVFEAAIKKSLESVYDQNLSTYDVCQAIVLDPWRSVRQTRLQSVRVAGCCSRELLSKVHNLFSDRVNGDGACHGAGSAVFGAAGLVAAFARVVLFFHQVVPCAEGDQMRVVGRRRYGDGASATHVRVTQLVRETLQLVGAEVVVVPKHVVVGRPGRALRDKGPGLLNARKSWGYFIDITKLPIV